MKKKNIFQVMPYFPPHIGGVEKVGEEIFGKWTYGKSFILSGNMCQEGDVYNNKVDSSEKIFFPSIDIVDNFPFPRIWTINFWKKISETRKILKKEDYIIITHTRFFFSSFIGGLLSKLYRKKWIHIEHGSDYVKLSSHFKNKVAYFYDRCIGKWVFKRADRVLAISEASKSFIKREFGIGGVQVWYRGMEFPEKQEKYINSIKKKFPNKIIVGYIGRLYKWKNVDALCEAFSRLPTEIKNKLQLVVIGGGEEYDFLNAQYSSEVYFTGALSFIESYTLQGDFDIHVHPSSPGGGLATTLLQAMNHGSFIVATPNEGACEVITDGKNGILLTDDSIEEIGKGIEKAYKKIALKEEYSKKNKEILHNQFHMENNIKKLYDLI